MRDIAEGPIWRCKKMFASEHSARPRASYPVGDQSETECYMRKLTFGTTFFVALVAASVASAQGTVRGAQDGAEAGGQAAGPVGADCGRFCGSGDRHRRRDSWSSPGYSCSRCEDVHRFRPHDHGTKSFRGEEVREVSTLRDLIWSEPGGRQVRERHLATGDAASTFS